MSRKIKNKKVTAFFIQDTGIFQSDFVVSIGFSLKEFNANAKKIDMNKRFLKIVNDYPEAFDVPDMDDMKAAWISMTNGREIALIIPPGPKLAGWDLFDSLVHEIIHVVQSIKQRKGLNDKESEAYLAEYLFSSIRKKIKVV